MMSCSTKADSTGDRLVIVAAILIPGLGSYFIS